MMPLKVIVYNHHPIHIITGKQTLVQQVKSNREPLYQQASATHIKARHLVSP